MSVVVVSLVLQEPPEECTNGKDTNYSHQIIYDYYNFAFLIIRMVMAKLRRKMKPSIQTEMLFENIYNYEE